MARGLAFSRLATRQIAQLANLVRGELPHGATGQIAQTQRADRDACEPLHLVPHAGQHPPNLAVATFVEHHLENGRLLPESLDTNLHRLDVALGQVRTFAQLCEDVGRHVAGDLRFVGFLHAMPRMREFVGQLAIVGDQNETFAFDVESADVEDAATKQGWDPNGELGALEFLSKGSHFRDGLHKDISELKEENSKLYGVVAEHIHNTKTEKHEEAKDTIQAQIRVAAEEGNTDLVISLSEQLSKQVAPEKPADPRNAYIDGWVDDNKWFNEEPEMGDEAKALYLMYEGKGETDPKVILPKVQAKIEERYPTHFNPINPNRDKGSVVEGGSNKRTDSSKGLKRADLTEVEGLHFDQFIKGGLKEANLLKSIEDERARHEV